MAQLTIRINGYPYVVACEDGQETHLLAMVGEVERRIDAIKAQGTQSGEARLLALAALLMADEIHDLREAAPEAKRSASRAGRSGRPLAETLTKLADRAEALAVPKPQV